MQILHAYGIDAINFGNVQGNGAGQTIAIIDPYHFPNLKSDLQQFDKQFNIPDPSNLGGTGGTFTEVAQDGTQNFPDSGPDPNDYGRETALDVEWAHAIAPMANILLVEATSSDPDDLLAAVSYARAQPAVTVVSMSFGAPESSTFFGPSEVNDDKDFTTPAGHQGITFVAGSGDNGQPGIYPSYSPNILSVGGTTLSVDASGNYLGETAWSLNSDADDPTGASGGGVSTYELQPYFQHGIAPGGTRTIPDVALNANTRVSIYDTFDNPATKPWEPERGTSFATPVWAALIAIADQGRAIAGLRSLDGPTQTLPLLYSLPSSDFHDISTGNNGYPATPGYDLVTGRGTPYANLIVPALAQATPPGTPNQKYVELTYYQLAERAVDTVSATLWVNELNAGVSRQTVAEQMLANHYSEVHVVDNLFQRYLQRQATAQDENWFSALLAGGISVEDISACLIGSQEYFQSRGGGTNNGFLAAVYEDVLGRGIDPSGQAYFSDKLAQGRTRQQVAKDVLTSDEYKMVVVDYLYATYLGRAPDPVGLAGWTNDLKQGASDQEVLAGIIGSNEYFQHIGA